MPKNKCCVLIFLLCLYVMLVSLMPLLAQGNVLDLRIMAVFQSDEEIRVAINQTGSTSVEIYDRTGQLIKLLEPTFSPRGIRAIDWNSDGSSLAVLYAGSEQLNIAIWDVVASTISAEQQIDFARFVYWHPINPNMIMIVLGSTVAIWDISNGSALSTYDPNWTDIEDAQWSPTGAYIGLLGNSANFRVIDVQSQQVIFERYENLPLPERQNFYFSFEFSPSEDRIALYDLLNTEIEIWNTLTNQMEIAFNSFDTTSQHYEILRWVNAGVLGIDLRLGQVVLYDPSDGTFKYVAEDVTYTGAYIAPSRDTILFVPPQIQSNSPFFVEVEIPSIVDVTPTFTPTSTFTLTSTPIATYTPAVTCTAASNPSALVSAITTTNSNGTSADTICLTENATHTFLTPTLILTPAATCTPDSKPALSYMIAEDSDSPMKSARNLKRVYSVMTHRRKMRVYPRPAPQLCGDWSSLTFPR